ncbi:MAG: Nif3-like dinuclear metal center hexameric protein [Acidimicrobiia bacterium]
MMTVADVVKGLATRTHPANAAEWDPVGLQLGDEHASVVTVGVCHEVTEDVVDALEADPVDLLVTYHPLLFAPTRRILAGRSAESRAFRLIQLGVSLLVTHTDFDAAPGGSSDALASLLNLRHVEPFGDSPDAVGPQIGRFGTFEGNLAVLDAMISDAFGSTGLRVNGDRHDPVPRVAVVPGSGASFIESAAELADALVTGDVPHHRAVRALDLGLSVVDPGHVATERPGISALLKVVEETTETEVVDLTGLDPSTWG